jgi:hypothetical protein
MASVLLSVKTDQLTEALSAQDFPGLTLKGYLRKHEKTMRKRGNGKEEIKNHFLQAHSWSGAGWVHAVFCLD